MKRTTKLITIGFLSMFAMVSFGQNNVGIGTTTPDPSAVLEMESTDQGVLVPRMTSAQRLAIIAPVDALLVYDTDVACFYYFVTATGWQNLCAGAVGPAGPAGPPGADGVDGVDGAVGPAGPPGADGIDGIDGAVGPAGPPGAPGADGVDGVDGAVGPAGPPGADGIDGVDGAVGPAGPPGAAGAAGPAGPPGADGATSMNGVNLTTARTIGTAAWSNVAGMSFVFTATTTSAIVTFSASGYGYTNSMAFVQFRVLNNGVQLGSTNTKIQSYDDVTGTITPWSCTYTRYVTGLTIGNNYTISVQGQRGGIYGNYDAIVDPAQPGHHMTISVIQ